MKCPHCGGEVLSEFDLIGKHFGEGARLRAYMAAHVQLRPYIQKAICRMLRVGGIEQLKPGMVEAALEIARQAVADAYAKRVIGDAVDGLSQVIPLPRQIYNRLIPAIRKLGKDVAWAQLSREEAQAKVRELMGGEGVWHFIYGTKPEKMGQR